MLGGSASNWHPKIYFTKIPQASPARKRQSEIRLLLRALPPLVNVLHAFLCCTPVTASSDLVQLLAEGPWMSLNQSMQRSRETSFCAQSLELCRETALQHLLTALSHLGAMKNMCLKARSGRLRALILYLKSFPLGKALSLIQFTELGFLLRMIPAKTTCSHVNRLLWDPTPRVSWQ